MDTLQLMSKACFLAVLVTAVVTIQSLLQHP